MIIKKNKAFHENGKPAVRHLIIAIPRNSISLFP